MISAKMSRYYSNKKIEADQLKQLSVEFLKKKNYFSKGMTYGTVRWTFNNEESGSVAVESYVFEADSYIRLRYKINREDSEESSNIEHKIHLTTTHCYFGGNRYWFICSVYKSGIYCGQRVGKLYLAGDYFACRHCYNLTYNSRNLGGISKSIGKLISERELYELYESIRTRYYKGKITRRYLRYLKKEQTANNQMMSLLDGLYKN